MHMKHGKIVFGYKDTYSLDDTLRPIIASAMEKFIDVLESHDAFKGTPMSVIQDLAESGAVTLNPTDWSLSDEDEELCQEYWDDILREIYWAFSTQEPDINKYDFSYEHNDDHGEIVGEGLRRWSMHCTNDDEHDRYEHDMKEYQDRVQKGYELFGKYLKNLWW